jgi:hypothetical protein
MRTPIALSEIEDASAQSVPRSGNSTAQQLSPEDCTLRYHLGWHDADGLEALRYARRSMLREEWTRGIEAGEPSLEAAVFSAFEVVWSVPAHERQRCIEKLSELVERANRVMAELAARRVS